MADKMENINISQLIKSSGKYDLTIFSAESIDRIEQNIFEKNGKYFLKCIKRNKDIQVKPEEVVRQLMLDKLINEYGYSTDLLEVEYTVNFGREKKFADIVILNKSDLPNKLRKTSLPAGLDKSVSISTKNCEGIDDLKQEILRTCRADEFDIYEPVAFTQRQRLLLKQLSENNSADKANLLITELLNGQLNV